jgi:N-acyl-D-amino-acid deacylase
LDVTIRGGAICDPDGSRRTANVAIENGRITSLESGRARAETEIDARGCLVAPGFIDIHTHSDFTLPVHPTAEAKLLQGVTTDVTGNCGFSPFPANPANGDHPFGAFIEPLLTDRWPDLRSYGDAVSEICPAINIAPFIGLGAVRAAVMGDEKRAPTGAELSEMRRLVRAALHDGAFGASTGLVYPPGSFADVDEVSSVLEPMRELGGIYASHVRDEGDHVEDAVQEALEVGRRIRCPVQLSHHKCLGRRNWGKVDSTLASVDAANRAGMEVNLDVYPYAAASSTLSSLVPAVELAGGLDQFLQRISTSDERSRARELVAQGRPFSLDDVVLAHVPSQPTWAGRSLDSVAADWGVPSAEAVLRLLEGDGMNVVMVAHGMNENDVRTVLRHPRAVIGSDGWTMTRDSVAYAHPRNFSSSVRVLARYVRDEQVLSLAQALAKLTIGPARCLGLKDRGCLAVGAVADLVVIDFERLQDLATYEEPCRYPTGIKHVLVRGIHAVEDGEVTGERAGRLLVSRTGAR